MERCPNCGAPARAAAKFCTICGHSLSQSEIDPPEISAAATDEHPHHEDDSPANPWPTSPTASAPSGADDDAIEAAEPEPEPEPEAAAGAAVAAEAEHVSSQDDNAEPGADQVISSSWPSTDAPHWPPRWSDQSPSDDSSRRDEEASPPADTFVTPVEVDPDPPLAESVMPAARWGESASVAVETAPTSVTDPDIQPTTDLDAGDQSTVFSWGDSASSALDEAEPVTETRNHVAEAEQSTGQVAGVDDGDGDGVGDTNIAPPPRERARDLLNELQTLLPSLGSAPGSEVAAIADELDRVAQELMVPDDDFSDVRAAVEAARDRPRDIDTVLDLSRRADVILAVFDAYDRALAALDTAASALRGDR